MVGNVVAKVTPERELGEEGSGHVIDAVVVAQSPEILHVGPEIAGREGPVWQSWRFPVEI